MTHIPIPREPSTALLRPFTGCPADELPLAWAAMVRAAEVQNARAGAAPAAVAPQGEYPSLPEAAVWSVAGKDGMPTLGKGWMFSPVQQGNATLPLFTADQLRAYYDLGRQAAPALEAPAHQCCNSWFLSLPEGRQAVLRENQWMLADAAYQAGRESRSALEAPAAPADGATPGPWFVRKREVNGELRDCFVAAPDCQGLAYDACILCDDEYHDGVGRKLADCELIVAAVNQHRAALAAAPQAPAAPSDEQLLSEWDRVSGITEATKRRLACMRSVLQRWGSAAPAAPAVDASDDKALLDFLQQTASTIEVLPTDGGFLPLRFCVGGLHGAVGPDVRRAIRMARGKAAAQAKEGGAAA